MVQHTNAARGGRESVSVMKGEVDSSILAQHSVQYAFARGIRSLTRTNLIRRESKSQRLKSPIRRVVMAHLLMHP